MARIHTVINIEGNAAKMVNEKKAEYLLKDKKISTEHAIRLILCEAYDRKYNCNNCGE